MNIINVKISFEKQTCVTTGIKLITGDFNSTKMVFDFDREDGRKVLEIKSPSDSLVYVGQINNNEVILVGKADITTIHNEKTYVKYKDSSDNVYWYNSDDEKLFDSTWTEVASFDLENYTKQQEDASLFNEDGEYVFEVSLYDGDSKLTSKDGKIKVRHEQVEIDGQVVSNYLPIFDELITELDTSISNAESATSGAENVNISSSKSGNTTTIITTNRNGIPTTNQVVDGANATINGVNTLTIEAGTNIELEQEDSTLTINNTYDDSEILADISDLQTNKIDKDVNNLTYYTLATNTGSTIELSINSSTYVMTLNLKNGAGTTISTGSIDLPLETMVVDAIYDNTNKKIVLTLKNGGTIDVPVADLVSGLQTEITNDNKLASDLVDDTNQTNKFVSASEKSTWGAKYDKPSGGIPKTDLASDVQTSLGKADSALQTHQDISGKEDKTNKVTSISSSSTDTQYPGAKCMYDSQEEQNAEIDKLKGNQLKNTATGTAIDLTDAYDTDLVELEIHKETTQGNNPSPTNPQDVNVVKGIVNLIPTNASSWEQGAINTQGAEQSSTTRLRTIDYYPIENDKNYYISVKNTNYCYVNILLYNSNKVYIGNYSGDIAGGSFSGSTEYLINIPSASLPNVAYMRITIKNADNTTITPNEITTIKPILNIGTSALPYVPYGSNYILLNDVGKNLFDKNNLEQGSINTTTGEETTSNYSTRTSFIKINCNYITLSWVTTLSETAYNIKIFEFNVNKELIKNTQYYNLNTKKLTVELDNNTKYIRITIYNNNTYTPATISNYFSNIQLEQGLTVTDYEPYQSWAKPLNLNSHFLAEKGDYADKYYIDKSTGKHYIYKVWDKVVLKGTENWNYQSSYNLTNTNQFVLLNAINKPATNIGFSNYFNITQGWTTLTTIDANMLQIYTDKSVYIRIDNTLASNLQTFKNWLSLHNVEVYYPLETPQLIEVPATDIELFNGINHLSNSEDATMKIEYVQDINIVLNDIRNAILEIGGE